jgi:hypothetical protein
MVVGGLQVESVCESTMMTLFAIASSTTLIFAEARVHRGAQERHGTITMDDKHDQRAFLHDEHATLVPHPDFPSASSIDADW